MPTISMFYGIIISMFMGKKEHNPPHIHSSYQDFEATFDIETGEKMDGNLPKNKQRLVEAWVEIHKDNLLANWKLAQQNELPFKIEGLK